MEKNKIRILVAEDELIIAKWLKMELETFDYEVCGLVSSGEEAIASAVKLKPDIILMDVYLNGKLSGIEAAQKIWQDRDTKIIFMTGYDKANINKEMVGLETAEVLIKPIIPDDVKDIIDSFEF